VRRHEQIRLDADVRGRVAERPTPGVARDHGPLDLRGPAEQERRAVDLAFAELLANGRRRDAGHELDPLYGEPELLEGVEVATSPAAEAEVLPCDHELRSQRLQEVLHERLRLAGRELRRALDHTRPA